MRSNFRPFALFMLCFSLLALSALPGCSRKSGCPTAENATKGTTNKKGELNTKGGKSNLFPKKMR